MHVVITTQVFPPEIHPTAVMAEQFARVLAKKDWRVTVVAGLPHHPTGAVYPGFRARAFSREEMSGFTLIRGWHPTSRSRAIPARAAVMGTQVVATSLAALFAGRPDVVLSFGGPPLAGPVLAGLLAKGWGAATVSVIHDIYPDVAIESGSIRNPAVLKMAHALERLQYSLSDRIVVLGPVTQKVLVQNKSVPSRKIDIVPVWLDPEEIVPAPSATAWRREQGIAPDSFVVLYAGTVGIVSGAEVLADVAKLMPEDVVICVVGGGAAWNRLQERLVEEPGLGRTLRLLPYQPRERLPEMLATADASVVTLAPGRGRTSVPSKVQGYMAAGRAVVAAVDADCDTATLIRRGEFGVVVPPADSVAIADAVTMLKGEPERRKAFGLRARAVFEREFGQDSQTSKLELVLRRASAQVAAG